MADLMLHCNTGDEALLVRTRRSIQYRSDNFYFLDFSVRNLLGNWRLALKLSLLVLAEAKAPKPLMKQSIVRFWTLCCQIC